MGLSQPTESLDRTKKANRLLNKRVFLPHSLELGTLAFFLPLDLKWNMDSSRISSLWIPTGIKPLALPGCLASLPTRPADLAYPRSDLTFSIGKPTATFLFDSSVTLRTWLWRTVSIPPYALERTLTDFRIAFTSPLLALEAARDQQGPATLLREDDFLLAHWVTLSFWNAAEQVF